MGIGYHIYNDNNIHLYTEDPSLLLNYGLVIFYTDYRPITPYEQPALDAYLRSGGCLLVTGFDSLVSDHRLADLIRSSSTGDNVGEPDLYVVDDSHPIMNGPYGSFPAGHHITSLYSDCDAVEADTTRMAVTVAELADGYDKIIATEGIPGKVIYWNGRGPDDWTTNTDCETMLKNIIAWTVPQIPLGPDLRVSLFAPLLLPPGESTIVEAAVANRGSTNATGVVLQILINNSLVADVTVPELQMGSSHSLFYSWTPVDEGVYNITAYSPPLLNETITSDNVVMRDVLVSSDVGTSIQVNPHLTTAFLGDSFTVSVDIINVTDLYGFDVLLIWDPIMLEYESHETTVPVEDYPGGVLHEPVFIVKDEANQTQATCWVACASMVPAPAFSGSGTVFEITFRTLTAGTTLLEISDSDLASDVLPPEAIPHYVMNGVVEITESTPTLHDVAILNVTTSRNATYPGHTVNITVVAANMGMSPEDFNVTVYYGNTSIETQQVTHLPPTHNETLTFTWNTAGLAPCNTHAIWAEAHPVPHETNTTNNTFNDGLVQIKLLGDLDGDDTVDIFDVVTAALAYGTKRGDPNWNQEADLAPLYGRVDIFDLVTITAIFTSCP